MLEAAITLIDEHGPSAVTIAAVAKVSQTSNGAIYHRFRDRAGLLAAAQDRFMGQVETRVADRLRAARDVDDDRAAVDWFVADWMSLYSDRRRCFRAFMIAGYDAPTLVERRTLASHRLADMISRWLVERFGCDREAAEVAYRTLIAFGASRALWSEPTLSAHPVSEDAVNRGVREAVLNAVGAGDEERKGDRSRPRVRPASP